MRTVFKGTSFLLALIMCLSLFGCFGGDKPDETEKPGNEKENTVPEETEPEPEKISYTVPLRCEKDGKIQWEYEYSPDGMWLSMTDYREETPITYTVTFDEEGDPLKREWVVVINDTRTEKWHDDYYLDENGMIVDEKRYCEGEIENAYTYTYDEEGRLETQESRNVKQENILYRLLYDEMGTHIGTRFKKYNGESGNYTEMKTCTYDEKGRIISEIYGTYSVSYEYTVDGDYVTQKKVTSTAGDYSWVYYYQYTYENGKMVREDSYFDSSLADSAYYTETAYEHYEKAVEWVFRERLP